MSRVFNISFPYKGAVYNALVTVKGKDEGSTVSLRVENDLIHLLLPHGKLSFPVGEVISYFLRLRDRQEKDMSMPITETISLHLMSPSW